MHKLTVQNTVEFSYGMKYIVWTIAGISFIWTMEFNKFLLFLLL